MECHMANRTGSVIEHPRGEIRLHIKGASRREVPKGEGTGRALPSLGHETK
jgi:hypothetical protein